MIEIYKNLYIGSQIDFESKPNLFNDWFVVHACKEPYHRNALGYTGRAAPKDSPYYFFLYDHHNHLIMNIVDVNNPDFFNDTMIDESLNYAINGLKSGKKVLIHCNQGESRAPVIGLMVLRKMGIAPDDFDKAIDFIESVYADFNPKQGILEYAKNRWETLYN